MTAGRGFHTSAAPQRHRVAIPRYSLTLAHDLDRAKENVVVSWDTPREVHEARVQGENVDRRHGSFDDLQLLAAIYAAHGNTIGGACANAVSVRRWLGRRR